jgi:hypothetical protein
MWLAAFVAVIVVIITLSLSAGYLRGMWFVWKLRHAKGSEQHEVIERLVELREIQAIPHFFDAIARGEDDFITTGSPIILGFSNRQQKILASLIVLAKSRPEGALRHLIVALNHDATVVQESAAIVLGELERAATGAVEALRAKLKQPDVNAFVRDAAERALGRIENSDPGSSRTKP